MVKRRHYANGLMSAYFLFRRNGRDFFTVASREYRFTFTGVIHFTVSSSEIEAVQDWSIKIFKKLLSKTTYVKKLS